MRAPRAARARAAAAARKRPGVTARSDATGRCVSTGGRRRRRTRPRRCRAPSPGPAARRRGPSRRARSRPPASIVGEPASSWKSSAGRRREERLDVLVAAVVVVMQPGRIRGHLRRGGSSRCEMSSDCTPAHSKVELQVVGPPRAITLTACDSTPKRRDADSADHVVAVRVPRRAASLAIAVTFVTCTDAVEACSPRRRSWRSVRTTLSRSVQPPAMFAAAEPSAAGPASTMSWSAITGAEPSTSRWCPPPGPGASSCRLESRAPPAYLEKLNRIGAVLTTRGRGCPSWPWMSIVLPDVELGGEVVDARRHDDLVAGPGHRLDRPPERAGRLGRRCSCWWRRRRRTRIVAPSPPRRSGRAASTPTTAERGPDRLTHSAILPPNAALRRWRTAKNAGYAGLSCWPKRLSGLSSESRRWPPCWSESGWP